MASTHRRILAAVGIALFLLSAVRMFPIGMHGRAGGDFIASGQPVATLLSLWIA